MRTIGVRELKAHLGDVLRDVRERDEVFIVTNRGRRIARLVPETTTAASDFDAEAWSDMDRLAEEIGRSWPRGSSAADAVSADRRDL